ncbi:MAG: branched-chain amino acid transport system II carrier protein [Firmicutes bacterium]|nr:branched-chain amino acid transport system II carrier protein [Bacillota bacterium]
MKYKLTVKEQLLVGLTLFSMFFGAGNLIFPPYLGQEAGTVTWSAMLGFMISAVCLPILGVVAVAKVGGLTHLANRVHPVFSTVFTLLAYLSIGPCLAIPRTASTSFTMAVIPFVGSDAPVAVMQLVYSIVFFGIAFSIALKPEKLTEWLGKILCPTLLILIAVIFFGCLFLHEGGYGPVQEKYAENALAVGFIDGYQTMDTIAALVFGLVIAMNINEKGVREEKAVVKSLMKAGLIAGAVLILVYAALAHVGALAGGGGFDLEGNTNGAHTLTAIVGELYGSLGTILLAGIFVLACMNTCIGLLSSCSEYFYTLVPALSYKKWLLIFAVGSMVISNAGLDMILKVSVPVLSLIYPVAIVLIFLALLQKYIGHMNAVYPVTVGVTTVVSLLDVAASQGWIPAVLSFLPFHSAGLVWIVPAILAIAAGAAISVVARGKESQ